MLDKELTLRYPKGKKNSLFLYFEVFCFFPPLRVSAFLVLYWGFPLIGLAFVQDKELVPFICMWLSSFLKPFMEDALSFNVHFFIFVRNRVTGGGWVCIWMFYSVPFLPSPCLDISSVCLSHSQSYLNPIQSRQFASDIHPSFMCVGLCVHWCS